MSMDRNLAALDALLDNIDESAVKTEEAIEYEGEKRDLQESVSAAEFSVKRAVAIERGAIDAVKVLAEGSRKLTEIEDKQYANEAFIEMDTQFDEYNLKLQSMDGKNRLKDIKTGGLANIRAKFQENITQIKSPELQKRLTKRYDSVVRQLTNGAQMQILRDDARLKTEKYQKLSDTAFAMGELNPNADITSFLAYANQSIAIEASKKPEEARMAMESVKESFLSGSAKNFTETNDWKALDNLAESQKAALNPKRYAAIKTLVPKLRLKNMENMTNQAKNITNAGTFDVVLQNSDKLPEEYQEILHKYVIVRDSALEEKKNISDQDLRSLMGEVTTGTKEEKLAFLTFLKTVREEDTKFANTDPTKRYVDGVGNDEWRLKSDTEKMEITGNIYTNDELKMMYANFDNCAKNGTKKDCLSQLQSEHPDHWQEVLDGILDVGKGNTSKTEDITHIAAQTAKAEFDLVTLGINPSDIGINVAKIDAMNTKDHRLPASIIKIPLTIGDGNLTTLTGSDDVATLIKAQAWQDTMKKHSIKFGQPITVNKEMKDDFTKQTDALTEKLMNRFTSEDGLPHSFYPVIRHSNTLGPNGKSLIIPKAYINTDEKKATAIQNLYSMNQPFFRAALQLNPQTSETSKVPLKDSTAKIRLVQTNPGVRLLQVVFENDQGEEVPEFIRKKDGTIWSVTDHDLVNKSYKEIFGER